MTKLLKIAIPLLVLAGAIFGYNLYNKERSNVEAGAAAYELKASELAQAFSKNETEANEKFLGEILQVTGEVIELVREDESYGLILDGGIDGSVYCAFVDPPQVEVGATVTIKGICSGYLMDVVINDCVLMGENQ